mmetsp:Transcript_76045/g.167907  ORF Transcript_76045/g.167907 Transcript_76045/m.167907 type:complete len:241 (-) Transcript_76045:464-1186(-)
MFAPELALVAPVALPFTSTPRVSDLDHLVVLPADAHEAVVHLANIEDAVGVPRYQAIFAAGAGGTEDTTQAVVLSHHLKHRVAVNVLVGVVQATLALVLWIVNVFQILAIPFHLVTALVLLEGPRRIPRHGPDGPGGISALQGGVTPAELGEGLLKEHHVELVVLRLREEGPYRAIVVVVRLVARDEIVDDDDLPFLLRSIVESQDVLATGVHLFSPEHGLDSTVMLRQAGNGCQQPAVS